MNRKQFIESLGATCKNWNWSWSFINEDGKMVIFGAWDIYEEDNVSLILSESWAINRKGRKSNGYPQSREHIRLIEEEGYRLYTFPMKYSEEMREKDSTGPAKIGEFIPEVTQKLLLRIGNGWYASDGASPSRIPEEIPKSSEYIEGVAREITINGYERNHKARAACLDHHGYKCIACEFDFESKYGKIGRNYIHVHHIVPISEIKKSYIIDPIHDLVPICPNCHAMVHRASPPLSIDELKSIIKS